MDNDLVKRLEDLKNQQEQARRALDRLEGQRSQLVKQLFDEFGVETLEEAEEKLETMQRDLAKREARVDRLLSELEAMTNDN